MTHLDHDHRKGENIRFLAMFPPTIQDFWRGPSCGVNPGMARAASYKVPVLNTRGKANVRDPSATIGIDEDIGLCRRQKGDQVGLERLLTPLRLP